MLLFQACSSAQVTETIVGKGWANNSVNTVIFRESALVTFEGFQFTAYYNEDSYLTLAKRKKGSKKWEVKQTQYKGNTKDAHNDISIALDQDGFLHVSWDHHDNDLRYAKSITPLSLVLGEKQIMTGKEENKVSYPQFFKLSDGLLFLYRSGQSGRGSLVANHYDVKSQKWTQLHQNLIDGENQRSAYWQACTDQEGAIHLSWVWRESWDVSTNHDLCYARSLDGGKTWEKSTGEKYTLPITAKTAEYAWNIPQNSSLINQTSMTTDETGNPYICSYWREDDTVQYQIVYLNDGNWEKINTGFRSTNFDLGGGGTKKIPISRPKIAVTGSQTPTIYLLYRDEERKNKVSLAYNRLNQKTPWLIKDLTADSVGQWEPNYDIPLWQEKQKLNIFVQKVTQVDGEGVAQEPSTPVRILEIIPPVIN